MKSPIKNYIKKKKKWKEKKKKLHNKIDDPYHFPPTKKTPSFRNQFTLPKIKPKRPEYIGIQSILIPTTIEKVITLSNLLHHHQPILNPYLFPFKIYFCFFFFFSQIVGGEGGGVNG